MEVIEAILGYQRIQQLCNFHKCRVGMWSNWGNPTTCPHTCTTQVIIRRTRHCENGTKCTGSNAEKIVCSPASSCNGMHVSYVTKSKCTVVILSDVVPTKTQFFRTGTLRVQLKTSDYRPSAISTGVIGVTLALTPILLAILADLVSAIHYVNSNLFHQ